MHKEDERKEYEFLDYISNHQLEMTYQLEKPSVIDEIYSTSGVIESNETLIRRYWADRVLAEWRRSWAFEWLLERSGREITTKMDGEDLQACCEFHLEGCLRNSYDNCDLVEKNTFRRSCPTCLPGVECPVCYNNRLDGWRPV